METGGGDRGAGGGDEEAGGEDPGDKAVGTRGQAVGTQRQEVGTQGQAVGRGKVSPRQTNTRRPIRSPAPALTRLCHTSLLSLSFVSLHSSFWSFSPSSRLVAVKAVFSHSEQPDERTENGLKQQKSSPPTKVSLRWVMTLGTLNYKLLQENLGKCTHNTEQIN